MVAPDNFEDVDSYYLFCSAGVFSFALFCIYQEKITEGLGLIGGGGLTEELEPLPSSAPPLKIGHELNKLASNIAFARSMAGVHWRSDNISGLLLGEQIAIGLLVEQSLGFPERNWTRIDSAGNGHTEPYPFFQFTKFNGVKVVIRNGTITPSGEFEDSVDWKHAGGTAP